MTVKSSANSVILILFAFSDNLSAENSKLSADSCNCGNHLLGYMCWSVREICVQPVGQWVRMTPLIPLFAFKRATAVHWTWTAWVVVRIKCHKSLIATKVQNPWYWWRGKSKARNPAQEIWERSEFRFLDMDHKSRLAHWAHSQIRFHLFTNTQLLLNDPKSNLLKACFKNTYIFAKSLNYLNNSQVDKSQNP